MAKGKIAVVGDRDSVMLFRALGVEAVFASPGSESDRAVHKLVREGASIIYITEDCAQSSAEAISRYATDPAVSILPIPNRNGSKGFGTAAIKANIEKAIGADILFEKEE